MHKQPHMHSDQETGALHTTWRYSGLMFVIVKGSFGVAYVSPCVPTFKHFAYAHKNTQAQLKILKKNKTCTILKHVGTHFFEIMNID